MIEEKNEKKKKKRYTDLKERVKDTKELSVKIISELGRVKKKKKSYQIN